MSLHYMFSFFSLTCMWIFQARERHNFFKRFLNGWAVAEFIKSNLKNKCAYACKRGYLQEATNLGGVNHGESEEPDKSENDGEEYEDGEDDEDERNGMYKAGQEFDFDGDANDW